MPPRGRAGASVHPEGSGSSAQLGRVPSLTLTWLVSPPRLTVSVTRSPGLWASAPGPPGTVCATVAPLPALASVSWTPRYACDTLPVEISSWATRRTTFDGIAKPTPWLPPESLSICELMPITWPSASSSGPPELPWLMAASVWIAPEIVKLFGASIVRSSALTMPVVTVSSRPNGLPIATTPSPTSTVLESANVSGCSAERGASTLMTATSVDGSVPTTFALAVLPSENVTVIEVAPSTTCWLVTMWPSPSITKPEPSAVDSWPEPLPFGPPNWSGPALEDWRALMSTTPRVARRENSFPE